MGVIVGRRDVRSVRGSDFSHQHNCWQSAHLSAPLISTEIVSGVRGEEAVRSSESQQIISCGFWHYISHSF